MPSGWCGSPSSDPSFFSAGEGMNQPLKDCYSPTLCLLSAGSQAGSADFSPGSLNSRAPWRKAVCARTFTPQEAATSTCLTVTMCSLLNLSLVFTNPRI